MSVDSVHIAVNNNLSSIGYAIKTTIELKFLLRLTSDKSHEKIVSTPWLYVGARAVYSLSCPAPDSSGPAQ